MQCAGVKGYLDPQNTLPLQNSALEGDTITDIKVTDLIQLDIERWDVTKI